MAVWSIWNNTFGINGYIALLPNHVGSTAKTSLACRTILRMHSIRSFLRVSRTKPLIEAFKAEKSRSLRSPHHTLWWNSSARRISLTGSQSWLSLEYLLFLGRSEKRLATDKQSSNCIRRSFPTRKKRRDAWSQVSLQVMCNHSNQSYMIQCSHVVVGKSTR